MSVSRGIGIILFLSAVVGIISMSSCVTESSAEPDVTVHSEPMPRTVLDDTTLDAADVDEAEPKTGSAVRNPFSHLLYLYDRGRFDEAREYFMSGEMEIADTPENQGLIRMWRGRLFLSNWTGSDMGLAGENVSAILADRDDVWMGTWTGGLSRFSLPLAEPTAWDPGNPSLAVRTVNRIIRKDSKIVIVRYGEIQTYDTKNGSWSTLRGLPVTERLQDYRRYQGNEYLAALGDGLWKKRSDGWEHVRFPGMFINRLEEGENGELLVATMDRGIYALDAASAEWTRPPAGSGVRYLNVTSVLAVGPLVVCGTYGEGAFIWDRRDDTVGILDVNLLGDAWVLALAEHRGRIYFATFGAGLAVWNMADDTWEHFGIEEGLPTADLASLAVAADGALWIGTLGGGIVRMEQGIHGD